MVEDLNYLEGKIRKKKKVKKEVESKAVYRRKIPGAMKALDKS